jgi:hypothetical protein
VSASIGPHRNDWIPECVGVFAQRQHHFVGLSLGGAFLAGMLFELWRLA